MADEKGKAERFLDRVDKRSTKKLRLRKVRGTVRLPDHIWEAVDRNRIGMGLSRSAFIGYCIVKVTKPYDQARAIAIVKD